jgi:hypothetical protein
MVAAIAEAVIGPKPVLEADPESKATMAVSGCGGSASQPTSYVYTPLSNWPPKFTLPATVQPLKGSTTFTALTQVIFAPASRNYQFTLIPRFSEDDDCDAEGASTIGCQNLRLGEDVPIAGTGFSLHYASDRAPTGLGDPAASSDAAMIGGWTLSIHHAYDESTNTPAVAAIKIVESDGPLAYEGLTLHRRVKPPLSSRTYR